MMKNALSMTRQPAASQFGTPVDRGNRRTPVPTMVMRISMLILGPCCDTQMMYQSCTFPPVIVKLDGIRPFNRGEAAGI
jgi:hypothetical protein